MLTKYFKLTIIFILLDFVLISQNYVPKFDLISVDIEVVSLPVIYFIDKNNFPTNNEGQIFSIGSLNLRLNSVRKIKKTLFFNYQFNQYTFSHPVSGPYIYNTKNISIERNNELYFLSGINFMYSKKKQYSGIIFSTGLGGGLNKRTGDNYLYNSRTSWCNSMDIGYTVGYKHFYFKPFLGLLSIFNFKEFIDYNNNTVINSNQLNYYSEKNPEKANLYKSSSSPNVAQIIVKYKYAGITNPTFLPRGLLCIGITF